MNKSGIQQEKQAESALQTLRSLLAEGINSGKAQTWNKDVFLQKMKASMSAPVQKN